MKYGQANVHQSSDTLSFSTQKHELLLRWRERTATHPIAGR